MDEIDLLRKFEATFPDPDTQRVQAARMTLMETLEGRDARLVPPKPIRRTRRRWVVPAMVAAGAVAIALVLPSVLPGRGPGRADPAAAAALHRAAVIAINQPAQSPPELGEYVYTKSENAQTSLYVPGHSLGDFSFTIPLTRETWIGPGGSGRILETTGAATFPTPADRAAWVAAGSPHHGATTTRDDTFAAGGLHYLDLSSLPTDPDQLLHALEARQIEGGPSGDWETFTIIGDLLRETYAPPALRAALYNVAANLPGVEYVGDVKDSAGRPGLGVAYTHGGIRQELIFDQSTAQLLGEREVLVNRADLGLEVGPDTYPGTIVFPGGAPGDVVSSGAYLVSGVVGSTQVTP